MITLLGTLSLAHLVADYPLQTDWMAENKHTNGVAFLSHVGVHLVAATAALHFGVDTPLITSLFIALHVSTLHGIVDSQDFGIRGDQTLHLLTIIAITAVWVM